MFLLSYMNIYLTMRKLSQVGATFTHSWPKMKLHDYFKAVFGHVLKVVEMVDFPSKYAPKKTKMVRSWSQFSGIYMTTSSDQFNSELMKKDGEKNLFHQLTDNHW